MRELFRQWLDQLPTTPGMLACGVRSPDRSSVNRSWSEEFPVDALDNMWRCAADTFDVSRLHQLPDRRLRWVFSRYALHCEKRVDGVFCGLVTVRDLQGEVVARIGRVLADFHAVG